MKLKYMIAAFALACFGTGCDDKLETFEVQGYTGAPAPIENFGHYFGGFAGTDKAEVDETV